MNFENLERLIKKNEDLERIIKNIEFETLNNYDLYLTILNGFMLCAKYNNIKVFKYLYTIFNERDLNNYDGYFENFCNSNSNYYRNEFVKLLYVLIDSRNYEIFRYLEPILLTNKHLKNKPLTLNKIIYKLIGRTIDILDYDMFAYLVNNYDDDFNKFWSYYISLINNKNDSEKKQFYQIWLNTSLLERIESKKAKRVIINDMIKCGIDKIFFKST